MNFEVGLKDLISPLVALAAVIFAVWHYRSIAAGDFMRPLREAQLRLYDEATSAAARIATLPFGSEHWLLARDEFLRLYYGPLAMLEDRDEGGSSEDRVCVEQAMVTFKNALDAASAGGTSDPGLKNLSLALAHACRESLARSWGYDVGRLKGQYHILASRDVAERREPASS